MGFFHPGDGLIYTFSTEDPIVLLHSAKAVQTDTLPRLVVDERVVFLFSVSGVSEE